MNKMPEEKSIEERLRKEEKNIHNAPALTKEKKPKPKKLKKLLLCAVFGSLIGLTAGHYLKPLFPDKSDRLRVMQLNEVEDFGVEGLEFKAIEDIYGYHKLFIGRIKDDHVYSVLIHEIKDLPETTGDLKYLEDLSASMSGMDSLPDRIGELQNLKSLRVYGNNLTYVPESIGNLTSLRELYLSGNPLKKLPKSITKLEKLEELWIDSKLLQDSETKDIVDTLKERGCKVTEFKF